jgi:hypothetical protein
MNPYASQLGDRDPLPVIAASPQRLAAQLDRLGPDGIERPYARAALEVFTAVRKWNLALIAAVPPAGMSKPVTHPERGQMTLRVLIETMAGHDLNHIKQIEGVA